MSLHIQWEIQCNCDDCDETEIGFVDTELRRPDYEDDIVSAGWVITGDDEHYCPICKKERQENE